MQAPAQATSAKLRGRIGRGDGFVALRLDGIIDEHNGLEDLLPSVGEGHTLLVDLGGVKRMNSVGVRDWVNWMRALRQRWKSIVLFDCPPPVMNEVNFVKNFAEGAVITTFQAPTFCGQCKKEECKTLDALALRGDGAAQPQLPSFRCERDDCQNALDDDEESYLGFLASLPPTPDAQRLGLLTVRARDVLQNGAAPIVLDGNATATRASALAQVGLAAQPDLPRPPPVPVAVGAPLATATTKKAGGDWVFVGAIAAMLAVLAVLVYLLMTLE